MGEQLHNYADWVRQRNARQHQAPQPFDNKLHTYTYLPNANVGAVPFEAAAPAPQAYTACYSENIWPQAYQYLNYPQAWAYPQYNQGYHFAPQANLQPQAVAGGPIYYLPQGAVAQAAPAAQNRGAYGYHHLWYGRTKAEVDADNLRMARDEGVNNPNDLAPHNPRDDQQFWVQELDGQFSLRTYYTIENDLRPGRWQINPQHGNLFFVRSAAN
ncbi:hypothetical protein H2201_007362 [Coniosporium apollinis]|uniref:Ricin B lectin domain-containing protein n=1 Tax=Coniosporium apollinis TaxID=61459 RepID=A0ABQ9NLS3_9PEZI|nr:hypothetical protein H2201_007362 [Coniosporium apollinis]